MKKNKFFILLVILSTLSKAQNYTFDDIFKTNKIYFFGYDFTKFKVVESNSIGNEQSFIYGVIQFMNDNRNEKTYRKLFNKDTVLFVQNTVNLLNSKIPKDYITTITMNNLGNGISKDSLQDMVNKYDTKGMSGIGLVQIIESFYKPKKQTKLWFVFFDIASKKILDTFENTNKDADSWHGYSEYWSVGLNSGMGFFLGDHYFKEKKAFKKRNNI